MKRVDALKFIEKQNRQLVSGRENSEKIKRGMANIPRAVIHKRIIVETTSGFTDELIKKHRKIKGDKMKMKGMMRDYSEDIPRMPKFNTHRIGLNGEGSDFLSGQPSKPKSRSKRKGKRK